MKTDKYRNFYWNLFICIWLNSALLSLSACNTGSGTAASLGNSGGDYGSVADLQIIAPAQINTTGSGQQVAYVVAVNPSTKPIAAINYQINDTVAGGSKVTIDAASASSCSQILANSKCTFKLNIEKGALPGSFSIAATDQGMLTQILHRIGKYFQPPATRVNRELQKPIVGIGLINYNSLSGPDGITLSYYDTLIAGTPYVIVNGFVASDQVGSFNMVRLVDSSNNPLPNQEILGGNLGGGLTDLHQGDSFSILLPIATVSGISQTIKVQTSEVDGSANISNVQTAVTTGTIVTTAGVGIVYLLPNVVYLTSANPEPTITLVNSGDTAVNLNQLQASDSGLSINFSPLTLEPGAATVASIQLGNSSAESALASYQVTVNYNNGSTDLTKSVLVYNQITAPDPGGSESQPTNLPVLQALINPDNNFFTTLAIGTVSRVLTLTNTGDGEASNIALDMPAGFSIAANGDQSSSCGIAQAANPALLTNLAPGTECSVIITYTNNNLSPATGANISLSYTAGSGTVVSNIPLSYRVSQSTAILNLISPAATSFGFSNLSNDGSSFWSQAFTIYNSGDAAATNLASVIIPNSPFSISSDFPTTLAAGESSSALNLQFGPWLNLGAYSNQLIINYMDYSGHQATPIMVNLTGSISNSNVALRSSSVTSDFVNGDGQSAATPYQLETGKTGYLTLEYYNNGNSSANDVKFATSLDSLLAGSAFSVVTDGCNFNGAGISLASGATCSEVLAWNPTTAGSAMLALDVNDFQLSYSDSDGTSYTYNSNPVYFNAYAPAVVSLSTSGLPANQQITANSGFTIQATLAGGYAVTNQSLTVSNGSSLQANGIILTSTPSSCVLSASVTNCTFTVTTSATTPSANYTISLVNAGNLGSGIFNGKSSVSFTVLSNQTSVTVAPSNGESEVDAYLETVTLAFATDMDPSTITASNISLTSTTDGSNYFDSCQSAGSLKNYSCFVMGGGSAFLSFHGTWTVTGKNIKDNQGVVGQFASSFTTRGKVYAYIVSNSNGIYKCEVQGMGAFGSSCSLAATTSQIPSPEDIFIYNNVAFVTSDAGRVYSCLLDSSYNLTSCADTGISVSGPSGIYLANNYAYIANSDSSTISICRVNNSTGLNNCSQFSDGATITNPQGLVIDSNNHLLIANNIYITTCNVNSSTGQLSSCVQNSATEYGSEVNIYQDVAIYNNTVYFASAYSGDYGTCTYSSSSGQLTACHYNRGALGETQDSEGVAVYNGKIYLTLATIGKVAGCSLGSDGGMNCVQYADGIPAGRGIFIYEVAN